MGELGALFNPGMRHEIEERESKANRREEEGNARDGDLRIDLLSGVAVINVPGKTPADGEAAGPSASRTVGEKPAAAPDRPARAAARARAAEARNSDAKGSKAGQSKSSPPKSASSPTEPAPGPRPSSKASRAGR